MREREILPNIRNDLYTKYGNQCLPRMQRAAKDVLRNSKLNVGLFEGNCNFKQVACRSEVLITDLRSRDKTGRGITDTISF